MILVDLAAVPALRARCAWAVDRIHLSEYGHHAVGVAALARCGYAESGRPTLPSHRSGIPDSATGRLAEARWFFVHALPWLVSRLPKVLARRSAEHAERPVRGDAGQLDVLDVRAVRGAEAAEAVEAVEASHAAVTLRPDSSNSSTAEQSRGLAGSRCR